MTRYIAHNKIGKLPPYGRLLQEQICSGNYPHKDILVIVGSKAWDFAKIDQRFPRLLLPNDKTPDEFIWPVNHCDCLVMAWGTIQEATLLKVSRRLLLSGANIVRVIEESGNLAVFWKDGQPC